MMAGVLVGIVEFERGVIREGSRSGIAAAKEHGKRMGRQPVRRLEPYRCASKVLALIAGQRDYRLIGRELRLSKYRCPHREAEPHKFDGTRPRSHGRRVGCWDAPLK
jgi:DNA invertase Pin-like site-specific DNA recombinase